MTGAERAAGAEWDEQGESELKRMSFLEHLEELRKRLMISVIALVVAFLAC